MNEPAAPKRFGGPGVFSSQPYSHWMSQPNVGNFASARSCAPENRFVAIGSAANTLSPSRPWTSWRLLVKSSSRFDLSTSLRPNTPPLLLMYAKYASTPSNSPPYAEPVTLLVTVTTPPTSISVSVTPGWLTEGNFP